MNALADAIYLEIEFARFTADDFIIRSRVVWYMAVRTIRLHPAFDRPMI